MLPRITLSTIGLKCVFYILIIALCIYALFPFYWMIITAFGTQSMYELPPSLIPPSLSLDSFRSAFEKADLFNWLKNTAIVALFTVVFCLLISVNAAYSLSRFPGGFNKILGNVILGTQMIPGAVLILPIFLIFLRLNLVNKLNGLILANILFSLPLSVWMLKGFFDEIPGELEEVAMIDGCTRLGAFYRVILPLTLPGLVAVMVFIFNLAWGEYFFARVLVTMNRSNWVFTIGLTSFQDQYTLNYGGMMAAVVIYIIVPTTLFVVTRKAFIKGLTAGAVKG